MRRTKNPRFGCAPWKKPASSAFPFTTGILIGIGETWEERIDSLFAIRELHQRYGHIQEVIVQNFRAKPDIPMRDHPNASYDDMLKTIALARLIFGGNMNIQAPPNLTPEKYELYLNAGINDWGGVSPLTPDFINPEAPWPALQTLKQKAPKRVSSSRRVCRFILSSSRKPKNFFLYRCSPI